MAGPDGGGSISTPGPAREVQTTNATVSRGRAGVQTSSEPRTERTARLRAVRGVSGPAGGLGTSCWPAYSASRAAAPATPRAMLGAARSVRGSDDICPMTQYC